MITLVLLVCGAAPPAPRDASLPPEVMAQVGLPTDSPRRQAQAVAFWADGTVMVTANVDGVRFWHLPTRRWQRFVPAPDGVAKVLLDGRGRTALFVARDDWMRGYDLRDARALPVLPMVGETLAVVLSADGSTAARAEYDKDLITVRIWDVKSGKERARFFLPAKRPVAATLALAPDGERLAAVLEANDDVVYSGLVRTATCTEIESLLDVPVLALAFSDDGKRLAVVRRSLVTLHSGRSGRPLQDVMVKNLRAEKAVFSPDGRTLALLSPGSGEKTLDVLELATGQKRMQRAFDVENLGRALTFSPDGGTLATGGVQDRTLLWDIAGRQALRGGVTGQTLEKLASRSGKEGDQALGELLRTPREAVTLLRAKVRPAKAPPEAEKIQQLVGLLFDSDPVLSEKAMQAVRDLGSRALSPLRVVRWETKDRFMREGLDRLIDEANEPIGRRDLRDIRAVEALEKLGTPEARKLLRELATRGYQASALTEAAWAALDRLEKRP